MSNFSLIRQSVFVRQPMQSSHFSYLCKMEKTELRAVIKYQYLRGLTPKEIIEDFRKTLGESAPSDRMVYNWYNEFKRGRSSTEDEHRSGRPNEAVSEENIEKVHGIVLKDRRFKISEIADMTNISYGSVYRILHEHLGMKKLSARGVPRLLTDDQKRTRVDISKHCLDMYKRNTSEFLRRLITVDDHYTPETKEESKHWVFSGESAPKKAKTVESAGKVLATVFLGCAWFNIDRLS